MNFRKAFLQFLAAQLVLSTVAQAETIDHMAKQTDAVGNNTQEMQADTSGDSDRNAVAVANSGWDSFMKDKMSGTDISGRSTIKLADLGKGQNFGVGYAIDSKNDVPGGKYAGIDTWKLAIGGTTKLFGDVIGGVSVGREVVYMQQFPTRRQSLVRIPYDPFTKIPTSVEKLEKNIAPGDFVGFRAPMTLMLGVEATKAISAKLGLPVSVKYIVSGEFGVQIFRMNKNQSRVRLTAIKDTTKGGEIKLSLLGVNGNSLVDKILGTDLLTFTYTNTETDLQMGDYVINTSSEEGRALYNKNIGERMRYNSKDNLVNQIRQVLGDTQRKKSIADFVGDLEALNQASLAESTKEDLNERAVIRVLGLESLSHVETAGLSLNFLRIFKFDVKDSKTDSKITIKAASKDQPDDRYVLDGRFRDASYGAAWKWGQRDAISTNMIMKANKDFKPTGVLGLQFTKIREEKKMSAKEYTAIKAQLNARLPEAMKARIQVPEWQGGVKNAVIQQDVTFNENLINLELNVSQDQVESALNSILSGLKRGDLKSKPMYNDAAVIDGRQKSFEDGQFVSAYKTHETHYIKHYLPVVINAGYSIEQRMQYFNELKSNDLFGEIGAELLLKLIPQNQLDKTVIARLSIAAKGQKSLVMDYPTAEQSKQTKLFRELLNQSVYVTDRTYNFRNYIKEDGSQYTLEEILGLGTGSAASTKRP